MSPLQTAVLIIALVTIVGVLISFFRKSSALAGYDEIKAEVPRVAAALKAEMIRDGDDLVLTGNYKGRPTQVRFSYAENTPGLNIRMHAPVSFTFSVVPKGARATEGRVLIRTGIDMLDARFAARTDHPTQARMLVGGRATQQNIEKLCCSQKTFLTMTRGSIELSELIIPVPYTGKHVLEHLESMSIVAKSVEDIPGAETVKVVPYEREKSAPVFRLALIIGAVAALLGVFFIKPSSTQADLSAAAGPATVHAEGVDPLDATKIANIQGWHALRAEEYDPDVAATLRSYGLDPNGRISLDLDGDDQPDVVYLLTRDDGKYRLAVLQDGNVVYDTLYARLVGAMPIAKSAFDSIDWKTKPRNIAGSVDALMLLVPTGDRIEPVVLVLNGRDLASGVPKDWHAVSLR